VENPPVESTCQACGKSLILVIASRRHGDNYSLASIMGFILVLALGLGLVREAPVLGVAFLALCLPATFRTIRRANRERAWGTPMRSLDCVGMFISTVFIMLLILGGSLLCFGILVGIMNPLSSGGWTLVMVLAGIPSLGVGILLARAFFRSDDRLGD
jgi:hypothetical protein